MAEAQKLKGSKRYGARYGRRVKHKLDEVESILKGAHKCPYCHAPKAKRTANGIWECKKCGAKFTGRAYDIAAKIKIREEVEKVEEVGEEEEKEEEEEPEEEEKEGSE